MNFNERIYELNLWGTVQKDHVLQLQLFLPANANSRHVADAVDVARPKDPKA